MCKVRSVLIEKTKGKHHSVSDCLKCRTSNILYNGSVFRFKNYYAINNFFFVIN